MIGKTISHLTESSKNWVKGAWELFIRPRIPNLTVPLPSSKFLPQQFSINEEEKARFVHEAKAAAALDHTNICTVHEIGDTPEGQMFIAMGYYEGETLKDKIDKGPLKIEQALDFALQIGKGLKTAHQKDIVHRDIKTTNIIITKDDVAKVLDFGLAKLRGHTKLTKEGTTLGTVAYMSPEQAKGEEVDLRSDIWSLGVVLYEMITGKVPFNGEYEQAIMYSIMNDQPEPITGLRTGVPMELERIINKTLIKDSTCRYQGLADFIVDIKNLKRNLKDLVQKNIVDDTVKPKMGARSKNRMISLRLSLLLIIISVAITFLLTLNFNRLTTDSPQQVMRLSIPIPISYERLGGYYDVALSTNGTQLVYCGNNQLYIRSMDQLEATPIPGVSEAHHPFFSPDGQWIGFWEGKKKQLMKVQINAGTPITLCKAQQPSGISWGIDDRILFGQGPKGIWRVSAFGGKAEQLISLDETKGESVQRPMMLPDHKTILYTLKVKGKFWNDAQIIVQKLGSEERRVLIEGGTDSRYISSGHIVYVREQTLWAVPFDLHTLKVTGPTVPVIEGIEQPFSSRTGHAYFSVSDVGSIAYLQANTEVAQHKLVWVDSAGKILDTVADPIAFTYHRISPDGKQVALTTSSKLKFGARGNIWVYDLSGSGKNYALTSDGKSWDPIWTPDGKRIVFSYAPTSTTSDDLYWIQADGSALKPEPFLIRDGDQYPWSFSADGKDLFFCEINPDSGKINVGVFNIKKPHEVRTPFSSEQGGSAPAIHPKGQWVVYQSAMTGRKEIWVRSYPDFKNPMRISFKGGREPVWSRDGTRLFYLQDDKMMAVKVKADSKFQHERPKVMFDKCLPRGSDWPSYDVSPDGRFLILMKTDKPAYVINQIIVVLNWFKELKRLVPAGE